MADIKSRLIVEDHITPNLKQIAKETNKVVDSLEQLNGAATKAMKNASNTTHSTVDAANYAAKSISNQILDGETKTISEKEAQKMSQMEAKEHRDKLNNIIKFYQQQEAERIKFANNAEKEAQKQAETQRKLEREQVKNNQTMLATMTKAIQKYNQDTLKEKTKAEKEAQKQADQAKKEERQKIKEHHALLNAMIQSAQQKHKEEIKIQKELNQEAEQLPSIFDRVRGAIMTVNHVLYLTKNIARMITRVLLEVSSLTDQRSRLNALKEEHEDIYDIQEKIAKTAMHTRTKFSSTIDSVVQLKMALDGLNTTTESNIRVAELLNKAIIVGGTKGVAAQSVRYNLQKALAKGHVDYFEWRRIYERSPYLSKIVAEYFGTTIRGISKLVRDGKVMANDLVNAVLKAGRRIDETFERMPDTFYDWAVKLQAFAIGEFLQLGGLHDTISDFLQGDQVYNFAEMLKQLIVLTLKFGNMIAKAFVKTAEFIDKNWNIIRSILMGIGAGLIIFSAGMVKAFLATQVFTYMTSMALIAVKTLTAFMLSNPVSATIFLTTSALIGLLEATIGLNKAFKFLYDSLLVPIYVLMLELSQVGEWFVRQMNEVGRVSLPAFKFMIDSLFIALEMIDFMIAKLNKIPFVNIGGIDQAYWNKWKQEREWEMQNWDRLIDQRNRNSQSRTSAWEDKTQNVLTSLLSPFYPNATINEDDPLIRKAYIAALSKKDDKFMKMMVAGGELDGIRDGVSIVKDDIKLLKDIARTEFVNKYTTLRPNMTVTFGDVRETADVNKLLGRLEEILVEAHNNTLGEVH